MDTQTNEKHSRHQQMLAEHRKRKAEARRRHNPKPPEKPWHKVKLAPIHLCY
jgi:hypothetical protein